MDPSPTRLAHRYLARVASGSLRRLFERTIPQVASTYEHSTGRPTGPMPPYRAVLSDERIPDGKVGLHEPPKGEREYSILSVSPGALDREEGFIDQVVLHEAIHYVLSACGMDDPHDDVFQQLAAAVGLNPEYRG